jgi:hypothetical protein
MNNTQIAAFAKTLKKTKNGTIKQKRELVVKINDRNNHNDLTINPILLQQTGDTTDNKIYVR